MKALVQNYVTAFSTESMYIAETINRIENCSAAYWKNNISAYDIFDTINPDIFFTHASFLKRDTIEYLSNSKIQCILNVTGLNQEIINNINGLIVDEKINCPLIYTNEIGVHIRSKINFQYIPLAFDVYNPTVNEIPMYNIDLGCYSINKNVDVDEKYKTFHVIGTISNVDIKSTILEIPTLCTRYKKFAIYDDSNIVSQAFYTSLYNGVPTFYQTANNNIKQAIKKITKTENSFDINNEENYNWQEIQQHIKEKHTCVNRVKSIFSNFDNDISNRIQIK